MEVNNESRPPWRGVSFKQKGKENYIDMSGRVLSKEERTRCCTDTLKRILVREDMADFEGAKYALSPSHRTQTKMWKRPCIRCKSEVERPKWQYICDKCKHLTSHAEGLPDEFLWEN